MIIAENVVKTYSSDVAALLMESTCISRKVNSYSLLERAVQVSLH